MKEQIITTEVHHMATSPSPILLVKVILDDAIGIHSSYDKVSWVTHEVADKIFDKIYPEIEKKIMADPELTKRITNEVLLKITGKVLEKVGGEKNKSKSKE